MTSKHNSLKGVLCSSEFETVAGTAGTACVLRLKGVLCSSEFETIMHFPVPWQLVRLKGVLCSSEFETCQWCLGVVITIGV